MTPTGRGVPPPRTLQTPRLDPAEHDPPQRLSVSGPADGSPASPGEQVLVELDGPLLRSPDGAVLAELDQDGNWYTPEGLACCALTVPVARAGAHVKPSERDRARREGDRAWMNGAHQAIERLAETRRSLTSDELWQAVELPPREARMIGNALRRAHAAGLIEPTEEHRPSTRSMNHKRPVRVWRSLRYGQQPLC